MIDAAPAKYSPARNDPALFTVNRPNGALIAVIDGCGSWGTGMEAASWVRRRLAERWQSSTPMSPETLAADIVSVTAEVPPDLRDPEWGWDFSVAVLLVEAQTLHALVAGVFEIALVDAAGWRPIYEPETLIKQLVQSGQLTTQEAETSGFQNIYTGRLMGDSGADVLTRPAPVHLHRDAVVVVAEHDVIRALRATGSPDWRSATAAEIQAASVACGRPPRPVVLLRSP